MFIHLLSSWCSLSPHFIFLHFPSLHLSLCDSSFSFSSSSSVTFSHLIFPALLVIVIFLHLPFFVTSRLLLIHLRSFSLTRHSFGSYSSTSSSPHLIAHLSLVSHLFFFFHFLSLSLISVLHLLTFTSHSPSFT